ncbi:oxidoreductase [Burkholderia gladioli pv. gladioli]|uniref:oxidoreductase n=1 Tax=Burkholderia gladioli TaxID=28095 RepID=UPI0024BC2E6F|nr:oxidoreductase [Burkholderia gladioli]MDJ1163930.1 oxidoreductase [Burkholderia gladioli pv. gladioli]
MTKTGSADKVWLITGCSSGLGRAIAQQVASRGYRVAVTARDVDSVKDLVANYEGTARAFALDVTDSASVGRAVADVTEHFGRVDVLVNNAGIGYFGSVEESDERDVRRMFDVNLFGVGSMIKAVLPQMRRRRSGHIVNVASAGGIVAFPAVGYYNASKWAIFGLSEALQKEVEHLGIRVTVAAPSGLRVRQAGDAHFEMPDTRFEDYVPTVGAIRQALMDSFGRQPGDPLMAGNAIVQAVESPDSPFRLLLGRAAVRYAKQRAAELLHDATVWEKISEAVDYEDARDEEL